MGQKRVILFLSITSSQTPYNERQATKHKASPIYLITALYDTDALRLKTQDKPTIPCLGSTNHEQLCKNMIVQNVSDP